MKLIVIHGLPGCGKLTVGRELQKLTGFQLFHNHLTVDLVESLFPFGSEPFVELRELIWLDTFQCASTNLEGLIFTFAYDRSVTTSFIDNVRKIVEAAGGELRFVQLKCSPEELERRIADPSRGKFGKLNSVARYRELANEGAFVNPGFPEGFVLDVGHLSPAESAHRIVEEFGLK